MKIMHLMIIIAALFFGAGCEAQGEPQEPQESLPAEVDAWFKSSLDMFIGQSFPYEGILYLLVTYGEKPTGGYNVEITGISEEENKLVVTANFTEPGEDDMVTEAFTYPYDLVAIEDPGLPVLYIAAGAENYLPTLYGLEHLEPISAGSQWIKIFSPWPGEIVARQFSVAGVANVFEGNVQYRLITAEGEELAGGFTTGAMGDWGYFSFTLSIADQIKSGTKLLLELYTESPRDGKIQDWFQVELAVE